MYNIRPPSVGRFFLFPRIFIFGGAVNMKECQYNPVIYHHNRVSWALPSLKHNKTNVQLGGIICHIDLHNLVKYFHPSRQPWILIAGIIWLRVKLSLLLCCCPPTAEIRERERERERDYTNLREKIKYFMTVRKYLKHHRWYWELIVCPSPFCHILVKYEQPSIWRWTTDISVWTPPPSLVTQFFW